ncbi:MAG: B12-binding domain-containing radical SAM protein [Chitinophagaceae bacterium]|nr:MAG: B12-binding domain-containing radical SAM protein [Chitinophagaceae bacterium]
MILLSHSYLLRLDPKQWRLRQPYPPLGTLYAAALLRRHGHALAFHDAQFDAGPELLETLLRQHQPRCFVLFDDGFNYLTKMCLSNMRDAAFDRIARAKRAGCTVIVSSSDSTDHFERYLEAGADYVLLGEAEATLLELVTALNDGADPTAVAGMACNTAHGVLKTTKRPVLRDLDALPLPAWDLLDIAPYRGMWEKNTGALSINIATTRGCPYKCNWCAKPIYGNRYNVRSPESVVAEMKWLKELFDPKHIWFCDDIFGLKPGWVPHFAELLRSEGLRIPFKIQSRADLLLQEHYAAALADAGCATVWMGAESGSQAILDAMDKGITVAQIAEATAQLRRHGIAPCFFIQFGYLGETDGDIAATLRMIRELRPHDIGISVSYPLPGTRFYEKVQTQLGEKANWTDSDELLLLFRNCHSARFYRQLHRYVHKAYRKRQALQQAADLLRHPLSANGASLKKAASALFYIPASLVARFRLHQLRSTP